MTAVIFLIVLAVLIFVHELGHFLSARLFGVRVDAFALGFGPKIVSWQGKETRYSINLIPFGGYVKIFGENPDETSLDANGPEASRSFVLKPRWQQAVVLAAGVLFNFIFAWLLYVAVFTTGVTGPSDGFAGYERYFHDGRVMISYIKPGSPADKAGLKPGDVLQRLSVESPLASSSSARAATSSAWTASAGTPDDIPALINGGKGAPILVEYARGPSQTAGRAEVVPATNIVPGRPDAYAIGMSMGSVVTVRLPIWISLWEALRYTGNMMRDMVSAILALIANAFVGQAHLSDITGPVGIAVIVGDQAQLGLNYLLITVAFISINLGIVNLIPFPALDGGRIVFVAIEGILGRRVSTKFFNIINLIGFGLLMLLMVVVTWKDIAGLIFK